MKNKEKKDFRMPEVLEKMGFFGWFIIFAAAAGAIAIERFTQVEINNFYARLILYIIAASLFSFWLGWILFGYKAVKKRNAIFAVVVGISLLKAYLTWGGDWKTQTVLYVDKKDSRNTIEFQMKGDWFAFGYKKRIVERKKIIPFFDYSSDVDTTKLNRAVWKRIDKRINQLGIQDFNDQPSN